MVALPAEMPVTTPPETVAMAGALLVHVPPKTLFVSGMIWPMHTDDGPVMALNEATLTGNIAVQPVL
jgi:hypothetical protein